MQNAWVVRPKPHMRYRLPEFLERGIVAIGWPGIGDLSTATSRGEIKDRLRRKYDYQPRAEGQNAGTINRFVNEMKRGDYVVVPDGDVLYMGTITSDYVFESSVDNDQDGYPHQRKVEWLHNKRALKRGMVSGRLFNSLKGRMTVFGIDGSEIDDLVRNKAYLFAPETARAELKDKYLKGLQEGSIGGVNPNTFENAVLGVLSQWFPGLNRQATTASEKGDTDLLAELPGNVTVRIQVKHFFPSEGAIAPWVVDQLADSMNPGDNGIIVTSGTISEAALARAAERRDRSIAFIDGTEFVDHLFEVIDDLEDEGLGQLGLKRELEFLV